MPKDTFFNLPEEKRRLIEDIAMDEFAIYGFDNASINRIVAGAKIAKGSFYQYFDDKKDVFKQVIARIGQEKMKYISPVLLNPDGNDFYAIIEALYRSGLEFIKHNPKAGLISNHIFKNREHAVIREIYGENLEASKSFHRNMLRTAIENGDVRADINQQFIIHVLMSLYVAVFDYYFEDVHGGDFDISNLDDDVMDTVKMSLDFIKNGIGVSNTGETTDDKSERTVSFLRE